MKILLVIVFSLFTYFISNAQSKFQNEFEPYKLTKMEWKLHVLNLNDPFGFEIHYNKEKEIFTTSKLIDFSTFDYTSDNPENFIKYSLEMEIDWTIKRMKGQFKGFDERKDLHVTFYSTDHVANKLADNKPWAEYKNGYLIVNKHFSDFIILKSIYAKKKRD